MQSAVSLPNLLIYTPAPVKTRPGPHYGMLAYSQSTGVAICERLDAPEVLRARTDFPARTQAQIKAMPLWAQPPIETRGVRGDWGLEGLAYRDKITREFGPGIFYQGDGWWQEVIKGDNGRIAVKTDDHNYTIYCYLPGQT